MHSNKGMTTTVFLIVGIVLAVIVAAIIALQVRASNSDIHGLYSKARQKWIEFFGDSKPNETNTEDNPTYLACIDEMCVEKEGQGVTSTCSNLGESCTLGALTAAFTFSPNTPTVRDTLTFNAETSQGEITLYEWDFGDGSPPKHSKKVTNKFPVSGTYTVKLTVSDDVGNLNEVHLKVTVNEASNNEVPPMAKFTVSVQNPGPGQLIRFTDASSDNNGLEDIETRTWDFGDGETSLLTNPEHTYYELGEKEVTLTVVDRAGEHSVTTQKITVKEYPLAEFDIYPNPETSEIRAGDTITLNGRASQDLTDPNEGISAWEWNISLYSPNTHSYTTQIEAGSYTTHTFDKEGTYSISLTVTSQDGNRTDKLIKEIEILPKFIEEPGITHIYRYIEGTLDKSTKVRIKIKNEDEENELRVYLSIKIMNDTDCSKDNSIVRLTDSLRILPGDATDFLDFQNLCYWPLDKETHLQITLQSAQSTTTWYKCVTCHANTEQCGPVQEGPC